MEQWVFAAGIVGVFALALWIARRGQNYVDTHDTRISRGINGTLIVIAAVIAALYILARASRWL